MKWFVIHQRSLFSQSTNQIVISQRAAFRSEVASLSEQLVALRVELAEAHSQKEEADKEQEDLLVLLEELSAKRRIDKGKLRAAALEVSDDDEEEEDEEEAVV